MKRPALGSPSLRWAIIGGLVVVVLVWISFRSFRESMAAQSSQLMASIVSMKSQQDKLASQVKRLEEDLVELRVRVPRPLVGAQEQQVLEALRTNSDLPGARGPFGSIGLMRTLPPEKTLTIQLDGDTPRVLLDPRSYLPNNDVTNSSSSSSRCLVYALGIAADIRFEERIQSVAHCEVWAFDCTSGPQVRARMKERGIHFRPWCIGQRRSMQQSQYRGDAGVEESKFEWRTLRQAQHELGHARVDILKMDIEGFEWDVIWNELIDGAAKTDGQGGLALPKQLLFELHQMGANDGAVPPAVVRGKGKQQANEMMLALHRLGYLVVAKAINVQDWYCAEFTLLREV